MSLYAGAAALLMMIVAASLCTSCLSPGLVHTITPVERPDVETTRYGTALIRSLYCDIVAEPLDKRSWRKIRSSRAYGKTLDPGSFQRTPPLTAFQAVIKNTVNAPIQLKKAQLCFGPHTVDALNADSLRYRLRSSSYSGFNLDAIPSLRRLISEWDLTEDIDYDRDTIDMKLDFIPPRDSILTIIPFERMPVASRTFKLRLVIAAMGSAKTIDFDFTRDEYRTEDRKSGRQDKKDRHAYEE